MGQKKYQSVKNENPYTIEINKNQTLSVQNTLGQNKLLA